MLDGILNNRKEWNAKKEEYEAKLKAIEDAKAAKAAATAGKSEAHIRNDRNLRWLRMVEILPICDTAWHFLTRGYDYFLSCLCPLAPANNPSGGGSGSKTCSVCWNISGVTSAQTVSAIATKTKKTRSRINKEKFLIWKELRKRILSEENDNSATHGHDDSCVMVP